MTPAEQQRFNMEAQRAQTAAAAAAEIMAKGGDIRTATRGMFAQLIQQIETLEKTWSSVPDWAFTSPA